MANKSKFSEPQFHDENAARAWFEAARWPEGVSCPHCGSLKHYATKKAGRYRCGEKECRKDFTVQTGTVMERSHAPLTHWAAAFHMAASSKKGFSAAQLARELGCQYNTAWFLHHRVMEAMRRGGLEPPMGAGGGIVEADETYFGQQDEQRATERKYGKVRHAGPSGKRMVVALIERTDHGGHVRTFNPAQAWGGQVVAKIVRENIAREAHLMTDESKLYKTVGKDFASHNTVKHSDGEYARGHIHSNTVENYFSVFKRGMRGVYQHCAEKNLHRYLAEFDFRYNSRHITDGERAVLAVKNGEGKRLTYRQSH